MIWFQKEVGTIVCLLSIEHLVDQAMTEHKTLGSYEVAAAAAQRRTRR